MSATPPIDATNITKRRRANQTFCRIIDLPAPSDKALHRQIFTALS
jgi:hypothetical protein